MFCNLQSDIGVSNHCFFITICQNYFEPSGTNALYIDSAAAVYNYLDFIVLVSKGSCLLSYYCWNTQCGTELH